MREVVGVTAWQLYTDFEMEIMMKKILVVGLGSISRRHIKNIKKIYEDVQIDILRHSASSEDDGLGRSVYSYDDLDDHYDAVFITNPTTMHIDTLTRFSDKSDAFFVEKPLRPFGTKADAIYELPKDKAYYVACPLRYTSIVQYLKENIAWDDVYSLRAISSSYLPDWRPGTDYSKCYSARKELGGGVAADLIHEWDYISYLIGRPERVHTVTKKLSDLDIDVEDIALYIGEYADKLVEVHLDYIGRKPVRDLYIFAKEDTIYCDFMASKVAYLKADKVIEFGQERDDYQIAELRHFFDIADGKIVNDSTIYEADRLMTQLEEGS